MEEKIEQILRSAGIESSPVDPSSMEALRQLVMDSSGTGSETSGIGNNETVSGHHSAVQVRVPVESPAANNWPMTSARAKASGIIEGSTSHGGTNVTSASAGTSTTSYTSTSTDHQTRSYNQILDLLHMHTILMTETQRKLDAMAAKVDALERHIRENNFHSLSSSPSGRTVPPGTSASSHAFSTSTRTRFVQQPLHAAPYEANDNTYNNNDDNTSNSNSNSQHGPGQAANLNHHEDAHPHAHPHAHIDVARPNNQVGIFQSTIETISRFYVVRICRLFWSRSRGYVKPIDGALIFKLVFMIVVMTARMSRSNTPITSKSATKLTISILMMLVGFLYHTKYLQFFFQFFLKDNIPMRVWAGEDVEAETDGTGPRNGIHAQAPRFRNPDFLQQFHGRDNHVPVDAQAPNVNRLDNLRQNFIGGAIHPPNQDQNPIVAFVQDTLYLLGSFFLSIFPMWQPLRLPPQQQQQDHPETETEADGPANNNLTPQADMQERDHDSFHAIPVVAPPRDVMTPAEDDSVDDDDNDNDVDDDSTAASLE